jgi:hypothetical protein
MALSEASQQENPTELRGKDRSEIPEKFVIPKSPSKITDEDCGGSVD